MKRATLYFLLLGVMIAVPLAAQAVYVPNSTFSNKCNVIPMAGAWPSSNSGGEWTYQTHLKSSAIARRGMVVGLAILSCNTQRMTATLGEIQMSHTPLATPSSTFRTNLPCATVVYPAAPFTWNGTAKGWSALPMTRAFYYDGVRNLTIQFRFKGAVTTLGNGSCDYDSSQANTPLRTYRYGNGAYTATTASTTGSTAGLKIRLLFANDAYVPNSSPSTGSCNIFPMGWGPEGRFQMIVAAKYLPAAPVKITDMAFAPCATTTFTASQFQVRMTHTTLTDFSTSTNFNTNLGPCPTVAYYGSTSWSAVANQWCPFKLKGGFGYDGKRNLLIEIRYRGGAKGTSVHRESVSPRLYSYGSNTYNAVTGGTDIAAPKVRLILDGRYQLTVGDTMTIGYAYSIALTNFVPGQPYQIAASFGQTPLTLGAYTIWLSPDGLFFTSLQLGAPVFNTYGGTTSICGTARGVLAVPRLPALRGLCIYHAAIAYTSRGVVGVTNTGGSLLR